MPRAMLLAGLLLFSGPAAEAQDWAHAPRVEVSLSSFKYSPKIVHLRAGQPVILRFVNQASGGHDFTAKSFFDQAAIRGSDRAAVADGKIDLKGGQSSEVALVPKAGRYPAKCSHSFHTLLGMTGQIIVE
jgi:plastocyanin